MKLIVGLGNPSEKYARTRHNVGFDIIDIFCRELGTKPDFRREHRSLLLNGNLGEESIILAKPQTYMNSSGRAVSAIISDYEIPLDSVIVIYDDLNLELGLIRIRRSGSAGGHNGIKSIISSLESESFPRLRVGIGQPPQNMEVIDYVLGDFSSEEREEIEKAELVAVDALKTMLLEGIETAMNRFNSRQKDKES